MGVEFTVWYWAPQAGTDGRLALAVRNWAHPSPEVGRHANDRTGGAPLSPYLQESTSLVGAHYHTSLLLVVASESLSPSSHPRTGVIAPRKLAMQLSNFKLTKKKRDSTMRRHDLSQRLLATRTFTNTP